MNVVAYTALEFEQASRKAAGKHAIIYTSPPLTDTNLRDLPNALQSADLILFNLHGLPGGAAWMADKAGLPVAIRAAQLATLDLSGAVVFIENCYAGDDDNPMRRALEIARARLIIAGEGPNYGGRNSLQGADWLFFALRLAMKASKNTKHWLYILNRARRVLRLLGDTDTADFMVWDSREGSNLC